jgi:hypothetical protein
MVKNMDKSKIRSAIGMILTDAPEGRFNDYGVSLKDCIDWLEQHSHTPKIGEKYRCIASPRYTCFRDGDIYEVKDNFIAELINLCSDCFVRIEHSY